MVNCAPSYFKFPESSFVSRHDPSGFSQAQKANQEDLEDRKEASPRGLCGHCGSNSNRPASSGILLGSRPNSYLYLNPRYSGRFVTRRRRRAWMQGASGAFQPARREDSAVVLDSTSSPTERNAADMPGSTAAAEAS